MNTTTHVGRPMSPYAQAVTARGTDIAEREVARLRETSSLALATLPEGHAARTHLEVALAVDAEDITDGRRLDALSDGIVRAQRLVGMESRASAILFLDADKRDRWPSYGAYRRDWDDYVLRNASRR